MGFKQLKIASVIESLASRCCGRLPSLQTWKAPLPPEMSAPAQKARPAPVTTIERTSSIAFTRWKKSMSSLLITVLKAFNLSGRLSVTVITPSVRSVSKVSYFMTEVSSGRGSAQQDGMPLRDCVVCETFAATDPIRNPPEETIADLLKSV